MLAPILFVWLLFKALNIFKLEEVSKRAKTLNFCTIFICTDTSHRIFRCNGLTAWQKISCYLLAFYTCIHTKRSLLRFKYVLNGSAFCMNAVRKSYDADDRYSIVLTFALELPSSVEYLLAFSLCFVENIGQRAPVNKAMGRIYNNNNNNNNKERVREKKE